MADGWDRVLELLDEAALGFHHTRSDRRPERAEQFDRHIATVRMVVEHTAAEAEKE